MLKAQAFPNYRAYLLRFWQEPSAASDQAGKWRFSLEDPHTGARQGFADIDCLLGFLNEQMKNINGEDSLETSHTG